MGLCLGFVIARPRLQFRYLCQDVAGLFVPSVMSQGVRSLSFPLQALAKHMEIFKEGLYNVYYFGIVKKYVS
jgi:hypothetical protein